ncbi:hypothetical protein LPJ61_005972, partial [Coemansia biformis]
MVAAVALNIYNADGVNPPAKTYPIDDNDKVAEIVKLANTGLEQGYKVYYEVDDNNIVFNYVAPEVADT